MSASATPAASPGTPASHEPESPPRAPSSSRSAGLSRRAQLVVPGLYAWGLTVGPLVWRADSSARTRALAALGVASLALSVGVGERRASLGRRIALFGLTGSSALAWLSAGVHASVHDALTGTLGMVGWAVFAIVAASPMQWRGSTAAGANVKLPAAPPRRTIRDRSAVWVVGAVALVMQWPGWHVVSAERSTLVRIVTIASACAFVIASTEVEASRRQAHAPRRASARLRDGVVWLLALMLVLAVGVVVAASVQ